MIISTAILLTVTQQTILLVEAIPFCMSILLSSCLNLISLMIGMHMVFCSTPTWHYMAAIVDTGEME